MQLANRAEVNLFSGSLRNVFGSDALFVMLTKAAWMEN